MKVIIPPKSTVETANMLNFKPSSLKEEKKEGLPASQFRKQIELNQNL
jgi:hypothetical protein